MVPAYVFIKSFGLSCELFENKDENESRKQQANIVFVMILFKMFV